jgi:phytoene dehydrogenase-like protein
LTAGNLLVRDGHQVTIFESHATPGGYIAGFWRRGFYFESGAYGLGGSNMIFPVMEELGLSDQLDFVQLEPFRLVSADFDAVPATYEELKDMVYAAYPDNEERLDGYFEVVDALYESFVKCVFSQDGVISKLVPGLKLAALYLQYRNVTKTELAAQHFPTDSSLYRFLGDIMGYPDMPAPLLGGYFYGPFHDYWTAQGGMQSWADALAANFRKHGGKLKLLAPVEKILTEGSRAVGVISQGQRYEADYVISACDYKQTFLNLLDPEVVPATMADKLRRARVSEGWVVVYLGLNISNDALRQRMQSTHAICYDLTADADVEDANDGAFFKHCRLELYSPSLVNPKLAPEGKASLMIMTMAPHGWMFNWGAGNREAYQTLKDAVSTTLIQRASRVVPGLPELIQVQDVATPLTFERYTRNSAGATCAWSWSPHRKFYKHFWTTHVATPVENLLIGSSWATQVGGIPFAVRAAQRCARVITKRSEDEATSQASNLTT